MSSVRVLASLLFVALSVVASALPGQDGASQISDGMATSSFRESS